MKRLFECVDELTAKNFLQHVLGQEVIVSARPVDDIVALAVRHHFVPVIGEEFVQVCQRILDTGWFVLLACLVVDGRPHEIARIERRQNDPLQYWRIVELAQAVFRECLARRKTLTIRVVGAEIVEKSDEFGP